MKIIINADDLGLSKESNEGILEAYRQGYITQSTFVVNSTESTAGAAIAHQNGFNDIVGLHLNLSEGTPLTEDIKRYTKYVVNNKFCYIPEFMQKEHYTKSPLYTYAEYIQTPAFEKEVQALRKELEAQIQKFISFGFICNHIDSHCNQLVDLPVWIAIKPLLKKYHFKSMRGIYHSFYSNDIYNCIYRSWLNNELQSTGLLYFEYISSISKFLMNKEHLSENAIIELYVHPILSNGILIDNFTGGKLLKDNISCLTAHDSCTYFKLANMYMNHSDCR